jgi:hypothetical protein
MGEKRFHLDRFAGAIASEIERECSAYMDAPQPLSWFLAKVRYDRQPFDTARKAGLDVPVERDEGGWLLKVIPRKAVEWLRAREGIYRAKERARLKAHAERARLRAEAA